MINKRYFWEKRILQWEEKRYGKNLFARSSIYHRMHNALKVLHRIYQPGMSVTEFGCGSGILASHLPPDARYDGHDFSEVAIKRANANLSDRKSFSFHVTDLVATDRIWKSDIVLGLGFIDWITPSDFENLLKKIDSQYIVFSFSNKSTHWFRKFYSFYSSVMFKKEYTPYFYSVEELRTLFLAHGYKIEEVVLNNGMLFGGIILASK